MDPQRKWNISIHVGYVLLKSCTLQLLPPPSIRHYFIAANGQILQSSLNHSLWIIFVCVFNKICKPS